eukprot:scaffold197426_cov40-Cyclotella_meneghiniana.AAC.2
MAVTRSRAPSKPEDAAADDAAAKSPGVVAPSTSEDAAALSTLTTSAAADSAAADAATKSADSSDVNVFDDAYEYEITMSAQKQIGDAFASLDDSADTN